MKFKFTTQKYQTEAVDSVVKVFEGQIKEDPYSYIMDWDNKDEKISDAAELIGYKNKPLNIDKQTLLDNINKVQHRNNLTISKSLAKGPGACSLDIEMETGTGKTYVYAKTIFELNKHYGWSKFIVIVPSVAIREGVKKSFEVMQDHFSLHYGKGLNFFIYDGNHIGRVKEFCSEPTIQVMIINMQAFNSKSKNLKINNPEEKYFKNFIPMEIISANNPILIIDEPQKVSGKSTKKALPNFGALFTLNYSATHTDHHDLIYALDSFDAYQQRLVKQIQVKGIEFKNQNDSQAYLYLQDIVLSKTNPPQAKLEIKCRLKTSLDSKKKICLLNVGDDLYVLSNYNEIYRDRYRIAEIDYLNMLVRFENGIELHNNEVLGDTTAIDTARIQIRETIASHFEKEKMLFYKGIKTLSLFFIDEVKKYRDYDKETLLGEYGEIFEEEYNNILNHYLSLDTNKSYQKYLRQFSTRDVHNGYFAIDKNKHFTDGERSYVNSNNKKDARAASYDLILKNKERLLSFKEPTRFIFSHSALREGWDNPNIFQICTLKHSKSNVSMHQEVGRGLRLCVDKNGKRMDLKTCGSVQNFYQLNKLTVISSGSYADFIKLLQKDFKKTLRDVPAKVSKEYFIGKHINDMQINEEQAAAIYQYLAINKYIDAKEKVTQKYLDDSKNDNLTPLPSELADLQEGIVKLINATFDKNILSNMVENGNKSADIENNLNDNSQKPEFQSLWHYINQKCNYRIKFNSDKLIEESVIAIDSELNIPRMRYVISTGTQKLDMNRSDLEKEDSFANPQTEAHKMEYRYIKSNTKYDLIGKIAKGSNLTRRTAATILKKISPAKFNMFRNNPERFIAEVCRLINNVKAELTIDTISYYPLNERFDISIFIKNTRRDAAKIFKAEKHIQPFVFTDGIAEDSIEMKFAKALDNATEVCVYAKMPKDFYIPTPVGNYTPDWAIAFNKNKIKHIYFVVETKGTSDIKQLPLIQQNKIKCAKKLFAKLNNNAVKYDVVNSYEELMNLVNK